MKIAVILLCFIVMVSGCRDVTPVSVSTDTASAMPTNVAPIKRVINRACGVAIEDSGLLTKVSGLFYKNKHGILYHRTIAQTELPGRDTLVDFEYFNGAIPQDLDPITFVPLDGWFAKDKHFVYYYRPVIHGMLISKMEEADTRSFKVLTGDYRYAVDKRHVYNEQAVIENLNTCKLKIIRDVDGDIIKLLSGKDTVIVEPVK